MVAKFQVCVRSASFRAFVILIGADIILGGPDHVTTPLSCMTREPQSGSWVAAAGLDGGINALVKKSQEHLVN